MASMRRMATRGRGTLLLAALAMLGVLTSAGLAQAATVTVAPGFPQDHNYAFVCAGDGFAATEYSWDFGDGTSADERNVSDVFHTFSAQGEYNVTCVATNGTQNSTGSLSVQVDSPQFLPEAHPFATELEIVSSDGLNRTLACPGIGYAVDSTVWQVRHGEDEFPLFNNGPGGPSGDTFTYAFPSAGSWNVTCTSKTSPQYLPEYYDPSSPAYHDGDETLCQGPSGCIVAEDFEVIVLESAGNGTQGNGTGNGTQGNGTGNGTTGNGTGGNSTQGNGTQGNVTQPPSACFTDFRAIPAECEGGIITEDAYSNSCRRIACSNGEDSMRVLVCEKPDVGAKSNFEMYRQALIGTTDFRICLGETCIGAGMDEACNIGGNGFAKSPNFPICADGQGGGNTTAGNVTAALSVAQWYPQGRSYVLVCDTQGFTPTSYDWIFGDGEKLLGIANSDVYHSYASAGSYDVSCTARDATRSATGTLEVVVG